MSVQLVGNKFYNNNANLYSLNTNSRANANMNVFDINSNTCKPGIKLKKQEKKKQRKRKIIVGTLSAAIIILGFLWGVP